MWLNGENKLQTSRDIDRVISAELPHADIYPKISAEFDIHHRWPPVQRLTFHLPHQQSILFQDDEQVDVVLQKEQTSKTMFLTWFEANKIYLEGKNLTYSEFPNMFVQMPRQRVWRPRKQGYMIGKVTYVPPGSGELYYMRILLAIQKDCIDYDSIKIVNGQIYEIYEQACYALRLLANDKELQS